MDGISQQSMVDITDFASQTLRHTLRHCCMQSSGNYYFLGRNILSVLSILCIFSIICSDTVRTLPSFRSFMRFSKSMDPKAGESRRPGLVEAPGELHHACLSRVFWPAQRSIRVEPVIIRWLSGTSSHIRDSNSRPNTIVTDPANS